MPRDGNGVAAKPAGTTATPNTLIESSKFNSVIDDIYALLNAALPITAGGTSAVSKQGAVSALFDGTTIVDDDNFTLAANGDQTKLLAFDLSGLTTATERTWAAPDKDGTVALTSDLTPLGTKVDTRRNRVVNGDMRMSQQNGTTSGTTNGFYPADQWAQYFVTSAGTLTVEQVASVTPAGSPNRIRGTVTGSDGTLAAGEYWSLSQNLEGSNVADFQYGGSAAKASVLRFGFKGPAGTYAVHIGNSAANRSFVALFTIAGGDANTDTVQTIAIPGDTTGTWLTADGVIGITLEIVLACGTTFQGAAGWQSGNILGTSAVSNGMATGSAVFELFDVGLKLDPDATGVYGAYEVGEVDAVYRSERYFCNLVKDGVVGGRPFTGMSTTASVCSFSGNVPVALAVNPSIGQVGCNVVVAGSSFAISSVSCSYLGGTSLAISATLTAPATAGLVSQMRTDSATNHIRIAARLS